MSYDFPPRPYFYPGTDSWQWLAGSYAILSVGLVLASLRYYVRCLRGRASHCVTPWIMLGLGLLHVVLAIVVWNEPWIFRYGSSPSAIVSSGAPLIWLLVFGMVIHALVPSSRGTRNAPNQDGCIPGICLLLSMLFLFTPDLGNGLGRVESRCRITAMSLRGPISAWQELHHRFMDCRIEEKLRPPRSWRVEVIINDWAERDQFYDNALSWDSDRNRQLSLELAQQYTCPATPAPQRQDELGTPYTAWSALTGKGTAFPDGKGLAPEKFTDGLSNTVLIAEAVGQQIRWLEPRDIEVTPENIGINQPGSRKFHSPSILSSYHDPQGAHVLRADGSARFLSKNTDLKILRAIITPGGGEVADQLGTDW